MSAVTLIRPAKSRDARVMANILSEWIAATAWFPSANPSSASRGEMVRLIAEAEVFVAVRHGLLPFVLGFCAVEHGQIAALYVRQSVQRQGIGRALLAHARQHSPASLELACFAANNAALAFYHQQGAVVTARTDGANDEGLPDIRLTLPAQSQHAEARI